MSDENEVGATLTDEQVRGIATAAAEAVAVKAGEQFAEILERAGAGVVDRSTVASPEPVTEERPMYGQAGRARMLFERQLGHLPQAQRDEKVEGALLIHDWRIAMSRRDFQRAEAISLASYDGETRKFLVKSEAEYQAHLRQLGTGAASGGALVPVPLENSIIEQRAKADKITQRATQHQSEATSLRVPAELLVINAVGTAENATMADSTVTYAEVLLTKKKATGLVKSSRELVEDASAALSFQSNISRQAGRAFGVYNNTQNLTGDNTGTNFTDGILINAAVTEFTGGALTRLMLLDAINTLPNEYWDPSSTYWMMDQATAQLISAMNVGGANGTQVLYPNFNIAAPVPVGDMAPASNMVEGFPVLVFADSDMSGILAFGNLDFFEALVEPGIRAETTTEGGASFADDQQWWKFVQRQDGAVGLATAFTRSDVAILAQA